MDSKRWQRVSQLYHRVRSSDAAARAALLDAGCADDPALRAEVESLLQHELPSTPALDVMAAQMEAASPAVAPGTRLGAYTVRSLIGEGGMGQVYRAHDEELGRDVAIKVLPPLIALDPGWRARFEREARVLASLNHPHVGAIYGIAEADGLRALVLELVEGDTLADRLQAVSAGKGLPIDSALRIARQIAEALDAAHERGIVHRDLKPANIKITPDEVVKVLDFGLAKTADAPVQQGLTQAGLILGTASYMSPEQARGQPMDKRTDIWAFGCILYEMLGGRAAFQRDTVADTLAAVIQGEVDWSALPLTVPGGVRRLLARCLERDPKRRLRDIGDARIELDPEASIPPDPATAGALPGPLPLAHAAPRVMRSMAITATSLLAAGLGIASLWILPRFRAAAPVHALRVSVNPPLGGEFRLESGSEISPNGRLIVYVAHTGDADRLWVRPLDELSAHELAGTEGAAFPFWSPDSRSIGYFAAGKLKRVEVSGGPPVVLCAVTEGKGGTWNARGVILFNSFNDGPILRVSASGGEPVAVTALDTSRAENSHRWPQFLPDGRRFLYFVRSDNSQVSGVYVSTLDRPHDKVRLLGANSAWYAPGKQAGIGYLLWERDDRLVVQPFDAETARLTGEATPIATGPFAASTRAYRAVGGREFFSTSTEGTLLYEKAVDSKVQLTWYGRDGKVAGMIGQPDMFWGPPRLSPDGKRIAVLVIRGPQQVGQVWLVEVERGVATPFAAREVSGGSSLAWAPDSQAVAYSWGSPPNLFVKSINGSDRRLTETGTSQMAQDWSPDGRYLLYRAGSNEPNPAVRTGLWALPLVHGDPLLLPVEMFPPIDARLSPDGHWILYTSQESGRGEIYLQRFPDGGMRTRVSTSGGSDPRWPRNAREVFYRSLDGILESVTVRLDPSRPKLGSAIALFKIPAEYDVSADGQRFLALVPIESAEASPMIVVTNWQADLKPSPQQ
jgi:Tol biopolymer transport system component